MKAAVTGAMILMFAALQLGAQTGPGSSAPQRMQVAPPAGVDLTGVLAQVQQASSSANLNIAKLRIEKWKTDSDQKKQMQQVADSLQKNISNAIPGLIADVQNSRGSVLASFKLYHNLNVVYEFLVSLAEAAGAFGKKEEYEPLAADANALDSARQNLSIYIEQAANRLENAPRAAANSGQSQQTSPVPGRKVVVIDDEDTQPKKTKKKSGAKSTKKKTSAPATANPTPTPAPH
jgi:hypothetical protein